MEDIIGFDEQIGFFNPLRKLKKSVQNRQIARNVMVKNTVKSVLKKAKEGQKLTPQQMSLIAKFKRGMIAKKKSGFSRFF
jgi:hypothetical protein